MENLSLVNILGSHAGTFKAPDSNSIRECCSVLAGSLCLLFPCTAIGPVFASDLKLLVLAEQKLEIVFLQLHAPSLCA